jgi:hypothetical protein
MGRYHVFRKLLALALILAWLVPFGGSVQAAGAIWYVKADASGANSGANWANAFTSLQSALAAASAGDQIWVAKGVYRPGSSGDRAASFVLKDAVAIYGGFAGSETSLAQRDWQTNRTVFSGDIDQNDVVDSHGITNSYDDIVGNNSYNVVRGTALSNTAIVDGVTVSAGHASVTDYLSPYYGGAGIRLLNSSLLLSNLSVIGNLASSCAGLFNENGSPQIKNSGFIANKAQAYGGTVCSDLGGHLVLDSVHFLHNTAEYGAGALSVYEADVTIDNSWFEGNSTKFEGGAVGLHGVTDSTIRNTSFISNTNEYPGGALFTRRSNVVLNNVLFDSNTGNHGGAVFNDLSHMVVENSKFINNKTLNAGSFGGAMYSENHSEIELKQVEFINNQAQSYGGALFHTNHTTSTLELVTFRENKAESAGAFNNETWSQSSLLNVAFIGNSATEYAGALSTFSDTTLTNVVFSGNKADQYGGALVSWFDNITLTNTSFNGNTAGIDGGALWTSDVFADTQIQVFNSIVWNNHPNSIAIESNPPYSGNNVTIKSSLIEGCKNPTWNSACGTDGGNNLADADPQFVSPVDPALAPSTTGYLMLKPTSPAIDQGDNSLNSSTLDAGGAPRVANGTIDLGAYEFQTFSVSVATEGQGTALVTPEQASYQPGDQVQLSANAAAGWEFAGWRGTFVSSVPTPTLTIAQSHVITATFRNLPPIVVVGADQTVDAGATVTLDASESYELDTSQTLNFAWEQVAGQSVNLSNADTAQPSFVAPAQNGTLEFMVRVSDNLGAISDPVLVRVTVQNGIDGWQIFLPLITIE